MSAVMHEHVEIPGGWGFRPGAKLSTRTPELPDLPLLHLVQKGSLTPTVAAAVRTVPELIPTLKASDLRNKYGIGRVLAYDVLRAVRA